MPKKPELNQLLRELDDALTVAKVAGKRVQSAVPYAGNLYDAAEDVIHACEQMQKEARNSV